MTLFRYLQSRGPAPGRGRQHQGHGRLLPDPRDAAGICGAATTRTCGRSRRSPMPPSSRWRRRCWPTPPAFGVGRRGMYGPACGYVRDLAQLLPAGAMLGRRNRRLLASARRRTPARSWSCTRRTRYKQTQLAYYKLGDGPFYVFYTPFHLPHIQLPSTIGARGHPRRPDGHADGRAGLRGRDGRQARPEGRRAARRRRRLLRLRADRQLRPSARAENALPIASRRTACCCATSRRTRSSRFDDVKLPATRLSDELWREQLRWPSRPQR